MSEHKHVQVSPGQFLNVQAVGLFEGEAYDVMYIVGFPGCKPEAVDFVPYYEDGHAVVLDSTHNPLTLWRPGFYQFIPQGELNERADVLVSSPFAGTIGASFSNVAVV